MSANLLCISDYPTDFDMKKQHDAPVTEHKWERMKPSTAPKIGPESIAKNAVPGIPNDWKLQA